MLSRACRTSNTIADPAHESTFARGLSVATLADSIGVSQVSIYFWEGGRMRPRDANLSALCKVLKLPIRRTREIAAG
jgi:DNA-binding XRE family transcriptional regulator